MENFVLYNEIKRNDGCVLYKGRRKGTITYLAIKCIDKYLGVCANNMARLMINVKHENVVEFKEWYETSKHYWIILELCSGDSLELAIQQDGCFPESCVRDFAVDIAKGLHYVHTLDVIFADLQPSKIWLNSCGVLKLADFSLGKIENENLKEVFSSFSIPTTFYKNNDNNYPDFPDTLKYHGNLKYLAPELLKGHQHSRASDLWSLGCIMFEMFTGHPPFLADTYKQMKKKIIEDEMPFPQVTHLNSVEVGSASHLPPSDDAIDLMKGLLRKDDKRRLTWLQVIQHPFWKGRLIHLMQKAELIEDEGLILSSEFTEPLRRSVLVGYHEKMNRKRTKELRCLEVREDSQQVLQQQQQQQHHEQPQQQLQQQQLKWPQKQYMADDMPKYRKEFKQQEVNIKVQQQQQQLILQKHRQHQQVQHHQQYHHHLQQLNLEPPNYHSQSCYCKQCKQVDDSLSHPPPPPPPHHHHHHHQQHDTLETSCDQVDRSLAQRSRSERHSLPSIINFKPSRGFPLNQQRLDQHLQAYQDVKQCFNQPLQQHHQQHSFQQLRSQCLSHDASSDKHYNIECLERPATLCNIAVNKSNNYIVDGDCNNDNNNNDDDYNESDINDKTITSSFSNSSLTLKHDYGPLTTNTNSDIVEVIEVESDDNDGDDVGNAINDNNDINTSKNVINDINTKKDDDDDDDDDEEEMKKSCVEVNNDDDDDDGGDNADLDNFSFSGFNITDSIWTEVDDCEEEKEDACGDDDDDDYENDDDDFDDAGAFERLIINNIDGSGDNDNNISSLIFHPSDFKFYPICKKFTKQINFKFDSKYLPFSIYAVDELKLLPDEQLNQHLEDIFTFLTGHLVGKKIIPMQRLANVMNYAGHVAHNCVEACIWMANAKLLNLLSRFAKESTRDIGWIAQNLDNHGTIAETKPNCQMISCQLMTTIISSLVKINHNVNITEIFVNLVDGGRRIGTKQNLQLAFLCTVGHLLLFIARYENEHELACSSFSSPPTVHTFIENFLHGTDVSVEYACSVIEQVALYNGRHANKFHKIILIGKLWLIYERGSNDIIRASAINALSRLTRLNDSCTIKYFEKSDKLKDLLLLAKSSSNNKLQQSAVTLFLLLVSSSRAHALTNTHKRDLLECQLKMLESYNCKNNNNILIADNNNNNKVIIKSKLYLCIHLMFGCHKHLILFACQNKLLLMIKNDMKRLADSKSCMETPPSINVMPGEDNNPLQQQSQQQSQQPPQVLSSRCTHHHQSDQYLKDCLKLFLRNVKEMMQIIISEVQRVLDKLTMKKHWTAVQLEDVRCILMQLEVIHCVLLADITSPDIFKMALMPLTYADDLIKLLNLLIIIEQGAAKLHALIGQSSSSDVMRSLFACISIFIRHPHYMKGQVHAIIGTSHSSGPVKDNRDGLIVTLFQLLTCLQGDLKCMLFALICDMIMFLMGEEETTNDNSSAGVTDDDRKLVCRIVNIHLFPCLPEFLLSSDHFYTNQSIRMLMFIVDKIIIKPVVYKNHIEFTDELVTSLFQIINMNKTSLVTDQVEIAVSIIKDLIYYRLIDINNFYDKGFVDFLIFSIMELSSACLSLETDEQESIKQKSSIIDDNDNNVNAFDTSTKNAIEILIDLLNILHIVLKKISQIVKNVLEVKSPVMSPVSVSATPSGYPSSSSSSSTTPCAYSSSSSSSSTTTTKDKAEQLLVKNRVFCIFVPTLTHLLLHSNMKISNEALKCLALLVQFYGGQHKQSLCYDNQECYSKYLQKCDLKAKKLILKFIKRFIKTDESHLDALKKNRDISSLFKVLNFILKSSSDASLMQVVKEVIDLVET